MHNYLELIDYVNSMNVIMITGANMSFKILHLNDFDILATRLLEQDLGNIRL